MRTRALALFFLLTFLLASGTASATCAGWQNSRLMYVNSQYQSTIPYPINLSTLYLNGATAQVMWAITGNNSYLCDSGSTNYIIKDSTDTTQQNMTNNSALVASYGDIFGSLSGLVEGWGLNGNAIGWKQAYNGTLSGTYASVTGKYGTAENFDPHGYVILPANVNLAPANNFTITAWIKPKGGHGLGGYAGVGGIYFDNYDGSYNRFFIADSGVLTAQYVIGGVLRSPTTAATAPLNVWSYVALRYNGSAIVIFVNGVEQTPVAATGTVTVSGTNNKYIGAGFSGGSVEYDFNGSIDEVRVWNRDLSTAEITAEYNAGNLSTLEIMADFIPKITIFSPTSTTYYLKNMTANISAASKTANATFALKAYDDGTIIYNNASYANNTAVIVALNNRSVGSHNFTVWADDNGNSTTSTVIYYTNQSNFYARDAITLANISIFLMTAYNSTYTAARTTTTGVVHFFTDELPYGNATVKITATGYNDTFGTLSVNSSSYFNTTYDMNFAGLHIKAFDEKTPATQLTFNLTVSNGTTSKDYAGQFNFSDFYYNLPIGDVSLYIKSNNGSGYPQRSYSVTINEYTAVTLYAYLLDADHGINVRFHIVSLANAPISGALVTAMKLINGSYVAVELAETDDSGTVTFWLDPTVVYSVKIEASGFISKIVDIQPTSPDFTIILGTNVDVTFNHPFSTISYKIEPIINHLDLNQSQIAAINFTISDSSSLLTYWGMNLTYPNGTALYSDTELASPGGGALHAQVNLSGYNATTLVGNFYFKKSGQSEYVIQRVFFIYITNSTGHTLWDIIQDVTPTPSGVEEDTWNFTKQFVALLVTMLVAAGASEYIGGTGAAVIAAIILGGFTLAQWFNPYIYFLTLMAAVGVVFLRGGF